jgi:hypothetical protein
VRRFYPLRVTVDARPGARRDADEIFAGAWQRAIEQAAG